MSTAPSTAPYPTAHGLAGCTCRYAYLQLGVGWAWVRVGTGPGCPFHASDTP